MSDKKKEKFRIVIQEEDYGLSTDIENPTGSMSKALQILGALEFTKSEVLTRLANLKMDVDIATELDINTVVEKFRNSVE